MKLQGNKYSSKGKHEFHAGQIQIEIDGIEFEMGQIDLKNR